MKCTKRSSRDSTLLKAGARGSRLSLTQANDSLERLCEEFPSLRFETVAISTPGDRDKASDLRSSDPDFFTRDLDDSLLRGDIDLAVHSAKDLPETLRDGLDFFWLPWREDPRDAIVLPKGASPLILDSPPAPFRIGVSSARREQYCREKFPGAALLPVRGNMEERIAQLDAGRFDALIMAAAGLARLGLASRVSRFIATEELEPPPGQGFIAVSFRKDDPIFMSVRKLFVKPVVFAGAGLGGRKSLTVEAAEEISRCEVCLYDSLVDESVLELAGKGAALIHVGKRKGAHSAKQEDICKSLAGLARQGKRALRLKGGDPGVFGRLAEETEALQELELPFKVLPGISSLQAATTCTGLLLTRRGVSRGFSVMTPRKACSHEFEPVGQEERLKFPLAIFMGASETERVCGQLIAEGRSPQEPASIVYGAGTRGRKIVASTLERLPCDAAKADAGELPGIIIVGGAASGSFLFKNSGAFAETRVLLACSEALMPKAVDAVEDFGGVPLEFPTRKLVPDAKAIDALIPFEGCDWIAISSPSSARLLLERLLERSFDMRRLPKIIVCGDGTAAEFKKYGIIPDVSPESGFSADSMLEAAKGKLAPGERVLRLRSDIAGDSVAKGLESLGAVVHDVATYKSRPLEHDSLPDFEAAFFSSPSNVESFVSSFGEEPLKGKLCAAIGKPTFEALKKLAPSAESILSREASAETAIRAIAAKAIDNLISQRAAAKPACQ